MKKKYFLGALLLGIFILTSCVDNEESLSVEELRKSKSELLKSQAALNAADAEAIKILAAADVALKNAQTEAEKANALKIAAETEIIKLQAELQETENEQAKVKLQNELERQKVIKAESEAKLKRIANQLLLDEQQLQADLAQTEARLLQAQKDLADLKDDLSEAEKAKLQELSTKYINKVFVLNNAKQTLSGLKVRLIQAENNLISLEETKAKSIEQNNRDIAFYQAQIEVYKQYTGYNGNPQQLFEIAQAKYNEYLVAWNNGKISSLREEYSNLQGKIQEKRQPVYNTDFYQFIINDRYFSQYLKYPYSNSSGVLWVEYAEIENENGTVTYPYSKITYPKVEEDLRLFEIDIYNNKKSIENNIKHYKDLIGDKTGGLTKDYEDAVKASKEAKEAWDAAPDDDNKKQDYQNAVYTEQNLKNQLENTKSNLVYYESRLKYYNDGKDVLTSDEKLAELITLIDAYNAQFTDVAKAYIAWQEASLNASKLYAEYIALWNIYDDASEVNDLIADREMWIKELEADNAYILDITSQKEFIERLKSTIDAQEKDVAVKQKAADDAKKLLDKALAEE